MRTIAICNQKGGVGKTTTTANLAAAMVMRGASVLVVDLDPQASLTGFYGIDASENSMAKVLAPDSKPKKRASDFAEIIQQIGERLYLAPSDIALSAIEAALAGAPLGAFAIRSALEGAPAVDFCLIDCPPNLGVLSVGAMVAANDLLIPVRPEPVTLRALAALWSVISDVREQANPDLAILGILPTFVEGRTLLHSGVLETMQKEKWPLLHVQINKTVRLAEAAGISIFERDPKNPAACAYDELAQAIIEREV